MLEFSLNNSSLLEVELETKMDDLNFEYMIRGGFPGFPRPRINSELFFWGDAPINGFF